jgi:hypothetical protein
VIVRSTIATCPRAGPATTISSGASEAIVHANAQREDGCASSRIQF